MKKLSKEKLQKAITLWNWLTRPYVLKSDITIHRHIRHAKKLRKLIDKYVKEYNLDLWERSNGSLILVE